MKRKLTHCRHRLKVTEDVWASMKHDQSIMEEARQMAKFQLDLYIGMNKDLVQELEVAHYKFI